MLSSLFKKTFGSQSDREFKKTKETLAVINRYASEFTSLSDAELHAKTAEFRAELQARVGELRARFEETEVSLRGDLELEERERLSDRLEEVDDQIRAIEVAFLDEIMPQAFGLVKEVCRRLVGRSWEGVAGSEEWFMVPYDVQLFGAMVLHQGKIAEMATGEGKTLVATMPLYLNALTGHGVHLITHNNYLAKRDAMWMAAIFNFLGLSVGVIQDARQTGGAEAYLLPATEEVPSEFEWQGVRRLEAYAADVMYGTKDQVGFDYLYDNMATRRQDMVQREFHYAIVDEADSNLIDDARTPLIISGPVPESTNRYAEFKPLVEKLLRAQTSLGRHHRIARREDAEGRGGGGAVRPRNRAVEGDTRQPEEQAPHEASPGGRHQAADQPRRIRLHARQAAQRHRRGAFLRRRREGPHSRPHRQGARPAVTR